MATEVVVVTQPPIEVEVTSNETTIELQDTATSVVLVESAQVQTNLWVSETYPGFTTAGIWVQTNVDGEEGAVTLNLVYDDGE